MVKSLYPLNLKSHPDQYPTWKNFRLLFKFNQTDSILRCLQYNQLSRCNLTGQLLDFGGGDHARYRHLIRPSLYHSVNIDPNMAPTWVTQVGDPIPATADFYDHVLSMNTFEHIYDVPFVLEQLYRCLKPGGDFTAMVPFLFPVHGHPDDFFRPTPSWWNHALQDAGFKNIEITPHYWGPFSTGMVCSGLPGPCKALRRYYTLLLDVGYAQLCPQPLDQSFKQALGYGIVARKP